MLLVALKAEGKFPDVFWRNLCPGFSLASYLKLLIEVKGQGRAYKPANDYKSEPQVVYSSTTVQLSSSPRLNATVIDWKPSFE